jgi:wyosine [tRNA(Phe)-imidazoG37] synthetase (radical SAM superfamily)
MANATLPFISVYGPVQSWRFGRSLGIDPIGPISTCSFNCVYCQLGEIEVCTAERQIFIPTEQIIQDLQAFAPWEVDVVTLSGSVKDLVF